MTEKIFGIDASLYQKRLNFKTLWDSGVRFVILKCSSGSGIDPLFKQHMGEAEAAPDMVIGAYHWADPTVNDVSQAKMALDVVNYYPRINFICADAEQWWADWVMWGKMLRNECRPEDVPKLTGQRMSDNAKNILEYWSKNTSIKPFLYTAKWYADYYAPLMSTWINQYPLWVATYPTVGRMPLTWNQIIETMPPPGTTPYMPRGSTNWTIWQWTDRIKAPGVYADVKETIISAVDGNVFNGNKVQFEQMFKLEHTPTLDERVTKLEDLAVEHGWVFSTETLELINS